ncbi:hypothetical protein N8314_00730 [Akkermansiaceae bacterium]|nr:hypothetical protein [Akkermansiaceae bacterium]
MYKVTPITSIPQLSSLFDQLKVHLELALTKAPEYNVTDVIQEVIQGISVLWYITDTKGSIVGVVTTQIKQYPQLKVGLIHLLGGTDINKWVHTIETLESWAASNGCDSMEIQGRRGWLKMLPDYKEQRVFMTKQLSKGELS